MKYALLLNPEVKGIGNVLSYALGMDNVYGTLQHDNHEPRESLTFPDLEEAGNAARDIIKGGLPLGVLPTIAIFGYVGAEVPVKTWEGKLCVEASIASRQFYIPCGNPAVFIVKTRDAAAYAMCHSCSYHNFSNRGAVILMEVE